MYISCPSCSTSFSVDGVHIGTAGRAVRCFNCGHTWNQYPVVDQPQPQYVPVQYIPVGQLATPPVYQTPAAVAQPTPVAAPQTPVAPAAEPVFEPEPVVEPEPAPEPEFVPEPEPIPEADLPSDEELDAMLGPADELDDADLDDTPIEEPEEISIEDLESFDDPEPLESVSPDTLENDEEEIDPDDIPDPEPIASGIYDPEEEIEEPKGSIIKTLIIVFVVLILLGGIGAGAVVMRSIVVDIIPATNTVFELLGMKVPIPGEGLRLQSGAPAREDRDGKEVIVIRGSITNTTDIEQPVPEILIRAIDAEEQVVQIQTLKPEQLTLAPGKSQKFTSVFKDLVPTARRLDVTYGAFIVDEGEAEPGEADK